MSTMCHYCSMESADTGDRRCSQMCYESFCAKSVEKEASLALYGDKSVLFCKYCSQDYGNEPLEQDGWSYYSTPLTSPAMSLTSYESCVSSLGELLVELNFRSEDEEEGDLEICQEDCCQGYSRYLEDQLEGNSLEGIGIENYNDGAKLDNFSSPLQGDESTRFSSIVLEHLDDSKEEKLPISSEPLGIGSAVDKPVTFSEEQIKVYPPINIDTDPHIWAPPEPESQEEDTDCSVPDNEGDHRDGYDVRKWGQSCSSSSPDDELGGSYSFKEQRQKAMVEVMNGRFRALVRKLLTLEAVPFSEESRDSWLDIVTYVSWKAATLIKPDVNNKGSDMDPRSYTKVKCIASGNRRESQVIRGLVFSKKAAHKHMLTNYKNPQLLLFYGGLGDTEGGLSSFNSIEQEIRYLKSTIELVESCCPNVVLVEKAVSHDVQESLQAKGITLVFDMKLSRLERIARCTGSSIVSSPEELMNTKLKQCDSFHTEKVVEEHYFSYDEGAKQLTKTLMFFEGCPIPLGCTVIKEVQHRSQRAHFVPTPGCGWRLEIEIFS